MGIFGFLEDDFGYDRTFDFDRDGKMDYFERSEALEFYTSSNSVDEDDEEEDMELELEIAGLDRWELEEMDEDARREALEDAGLDPDDFDFY